MLSLPLAARPALASPCVSSRQFLAAAALCVRRHSTHTLPRTVPKSAAVSELQVSELARFIGSARQLVVLTGAGVSTESNIPDYRSPGVGLYVSSNHKPILHKEFMEQNVDSLHTAAGSVRVLELHGTGHYVRCMRCGERSPRWLLQRQLVAMNPKWHPLELERRGITTPDGDSALEDVEYATFRYPHCSSHHCRTHHAGPGMLKPDLVFFGGTVPVPTVEFAQKMVRQSDAFLVLGSSLQVYSGYRFVRLAAEVGVPVCIVNIGPTRGDPHATLKIDGRVGDVLPRAVRALVRGL